MLSVFPLASTIAAVAYLLMHATTGFEYSNSDLLIYGEPGLSLAIAVGLTLSEFAAAGLVIFLLVRNVEGLGSIGLGGHRLKKDLALVLPVWILVQVVPQALGSHLTASLHLPTWSVGGPELPAAFLVVGLLKSLQAAVVEEVVVLGYLLRRLEQRGWSGAAILVVAVLIRVSYHLYYGPGILPIVLWAIASVLVYRRLRRLLPFIICHFVWDASISLHSFVSPTAAAIFNGVFFVAAVICTLLWIREPTTPVLEPALA